MSQVSVCIDWMRYTAHFGKGGLAGLPKYFSPERLCDEVLPFHSFFKEAKPRNGYTVALESTRYPGVTVSWSANRPDMGVSVDIPGSACAELEVSEVLAYVYENQFEMSRIDVAVDVPEWWNGALFYEHLTEGLVDTQAKKHQFIRSNTGWTVYVGSRTSERFLRIYDKQAQTGGTGPWTRVELECKGEYARGVAAFLHLNQLQGIPAIIRGFADWRSRDEWTANMASPTPFFGVPKREKHADVQKWLLQSVAPSFVRECFADPQFLDKWMERISTIEGGYTRVGEGDIFDGKGDFEL